MVVDQQQVVHSANLCDRNFNDTNTCLRYRPALMGMPKAMSCPEASRSNSSHLTETGSLNIGAVVARHDRAINCCCCCCCFTHTITCTHVPSHHNTHQSPVTPSFSRHSLQYHLVAAGGCHPGGNPTHLPGHVKGLMSRGSCM